MKLGKPTAQAKSPLRRVLGRSEQSLRRVFPEFGAPGSRSGQVLRISTTDGQAGSSAEVSYGPDRPLVQRMGTKDLKRFGTLRFLGTFGSVLIMVGGWGAGALPVVGNTFWSLPIASLMGRMLLTSTSMVFVGIGMLVTAWISMGYFALAGPRDRGHRWVTPQVMIRTFIAWVTPLIFTAPLFTQDIYSYIAQGAIAARGLNPYSGGPVDLLGVSDPLARSVPLIWSHSPSPYGPVAIVEGELISWITGTNVVAAVMLYRLVSIAGLVLCGWALIHLSRRVGVSASASLWLGVLNPLSLLHLVGGIHNESLMMGLLLVGLELCLRSFSRVVSATDPSQTLHETRYMTWIYFLAGIAALCAATMVKVTSIVALAFIWVVMVRRWNGRKLRWISTAAIMGALTVIYIVGFSMITGLGLGWLTVQGGAADIVSWMSVTTLLGLLSGVVGGFLGLGDQTPAMMTFTHGLGLAIGGIWMIRMLLATYRGRLHVLGGYGIGMLVLVFLFPVVHPWYVLWAILPLSAWANQPLFRNAVVFYSGILSFFVLPRGLKIPAWNVVETYVVAVIIVVLIEFVFWRYFARQGASSHHETPRRSGSVQR